jgi:FAD/FMN-containing dehydrogenase
LLKPKQVKGGGHIADPGFNSTTGILIDLALFTEMYYDKDTQSVYISPGLLWEQVYTFLNAVGRNVAGASTCQGVGVAGFNLGGGFSNKTNQYGLALDSIIAIDVVLPNGDMVTADSASNADLFWALKVRL